LEADPLVQNLERRIVANRDKLRELYALIAGELKWLADFRDFTARVAGNDYRLRFSGFEIWYEQVYESGQIGQQHLLHNLRGESLPLMVPSLVLLVTQIVEYAKKQEKLSAEAVSSATALLVSLQTLKA
jgi:hypothetical protein